MAHRLNNLPVDVQRKIQGIYDQSFPFDLRIYLASFLEECGTHIFGPHLYYQGDQSLLKAGTFYELLIQNLQAAIKLENIQNAQLGLKLQQVLEYFNKFYSHNPLLLAKTIYEKLQQENQIIQSAMNGVTSFMVTTDESVSELNDQFVKMTLRSDELVNDLKALSDRKEQVQIIFQEYQRYQAFLNGNVSLDKTQREVWEKAKNERMQTLNNEIQLMTAGRTNWLVKAQELINCTTHVQRRVLDEKLEGWKRDQQLGGNGGSRYGEEHLNQISHWCEKLYDVQINMISQLVTYPTITIQDKEQSHLRSNTASYYNETYENLRELLIKSYIIEKQPPQVMKTNTRFTSTVRLLIGGQIVKQQNHFKPVQVKVYIISEQQAFNFTRAKLEGRLVNVESSGEILNSEGPLETNSNNGTVTAQFRNMQLKKIKRAEKKGSESVMDEKFALLFQTSLKLNEDIVEVWTLSLPVVVIVHGNQDPHAWATVTWDNAFATPGRDPFRVPDKVPWSHVAEVLSMKFRSFVGRELLPDALRFLAEKALRKPPGNVVHDHEFLSWALFAKDPLPDRQFTFWEWFYAILKVTREHLKNVWLESAAIGFISRKRTEEILLQKPIGTFLLRFSDTELGGVTIAWVGESQDGSPEVFMVQPFTSRDFAIRGLPDRINDLKNIHYLYPDIPKDQVFQKFYTKVNEQPQQPNGYVKPWLALTLPGSCGSTIGDYPNTPPSAMSGYPHSPESVSYQDPSSIPASTSNDYIGPGAGPSEVPDDILAQLLDFDSDMTEMPQDLDSLMTSLQSK